MSDNAMPNRKLGPFELHTAESVEGAYVAKPEEGTTLAEMLVPEYWATVAQKLRQGTIISVWPQGFEWYARLVVRDVGSFAARVALLPGYPLHFDAKAALMAAPETPAGYEISYLGKRGWAVKRLKDGVVVKEGERDRISAAAWLDRELKTLA
jgi:hypothetical protein